MSVSMPGVISALSMKPIPAMLVRTIVQNLSSLARETETDPSSPEQGNSAQRGASGGAEASGALDRRA